MHLVQYSAFNFNVLVSSDSGKHFPCTYVCVWSPTCRCLAFPLSWNTFPDPDLTVLAKKPYYAHLFCVCACASGRGFQQFKLSWHLQMNLYKKKLWTIAFDERATEKISFCKNHSNSTYICTFFRIWCHIRWFCRICRVWLTMGKTSSSEKEIEFFPLFKKVFLYESGISIKIYWCKFFPLVIRHWKFDLVFWKRRLTPYGASSRNKL